MVCVKAKEMSAMYRKDNSGVCSGGKIWGRLMYMNNNKDISYKRNKSKFKPLTPTCPALLSPGSTILE